MGKIKILSKEIKEYNIQALSFDDVFYTHVHFESDGRKDDIRIPFEIIDEKVIKKYIKDYLRSRDDWN